MIENLDTKYNQALDEIERLRIHLEKALRELDYQFHSNSQLPSYQKTWQHCLFCKTLMTFNFELEYGNTK